MVVLPLAILSAGSTERDLFPDAPDPEPQLVSCGCHPPVLVRAVDELVLWGWGIIRVAQSLDLEELPVIYFSGPPEEELVMALRLEARGDRYSYRERELLLSRALGAGLREAEIERLLGPLVTSDGAFTATTKRFAALDDSLRRAVAEGVIDLKTAERAAGAAKERTALLDRFLSSSRLLSLSFSRRRMSVALLAEITRREPERVAGIAEEALASDAPDEFLRARRYPSLTAHSNRFEACRSRIESGTGLRIHAPDHFEGQSFTLEIPFRSREELLERLDRARIVEGHCDELFSLLQ